MYQLHLSIITEVNGTGRGYAYTTHGIQEFLKLDSRAIVTKIIN